jgi:chromosome segregation ATPase
MWPMVAEGAAAINERFWGIMGKLWQDNSHERHEASDQLRKYTVEHKIHVCDVSQTVDPKNKPDWQLRSEASRLRRMVETLQAEIEQLKHARKAEDQAHDVDALQAEIKQLKRARDKEAEAHQTARCAFEVLQGILEEQLRRAKAEAADAQSALAQEQQAHRLAVATLNEAEARLARLKAHHEQSEALAIDLKRQLQTLNAHAQSLRADLAGATELREELEHALEVAAATAIERQRELLTLKTQHRHTHTRRPSAAA